MAEAGVGWCHGGIEDVHLLQLHVTVELLQLRGLHALQLREVILREALELAVYMVCGEIPVMICGDTQGGGVSQGAMAGHSNTKSFTLISSYDFMHYIVLYSKDSGLERFPRTCQD